jgi:protein SCO1/2
MPRVALLVVAAALLAGCGSSAKKAEVQPPAKKTFSGGELTPPKQAPPLALRDADGRAVSLAAQRGKLVLVTFLYTHCPDVCPLIAQNLNAALRALPTSQRDGVRVIAVSVDPKGDTPAAVRRFRKRLQLLPQFDYLIGTRSQLRKVWAAWSVLSVQDGPELVDHVAYTALVDRSGKERVLYGAQVQAKQVIHDLRLLMGRREAA